MNEVVFIGTLIVGCLISGFFYSVMGPILMFLFCFSSVLIMLEPQYWMFGIYNIVAGGFFAYKNAQALQVKNIEEKLRIAGGILYSVTPIVYVFWLLESSGKL